MERVRVAVMLAGVLPAAVLWGLAQEMKKHPAAFFHPHDLLKLVRQFVGLEE